LIELFFKRQTSNYTLFLGEPADNTGQNFDDAVILSQRRIVFGCWRHVNNQESHRVDSEEDLDDLFSVSKKAVHR